MNIATPLGSYYNQTLEHYFSTFFWFFSQSLLFSSHFPLWLPSLMSAPFAHTHLQPPWNIPVYQYYLRIRYTCASPPPHPTHLHNFYLWPLQNILGAYKGDIGSPVGKYWSS